MNLPFVLAVAVEALGWCLVHFLWQAALVGMAYALARRVLPRGNPRYVAAMLTLVVLAACPVATAWHELRVFTQPVDLGSVLVAGVADSHTRTVTGSAGNWLVSLRLALPWLVLVWALGVAILATRVVRQWRGLRALVRAAEALPDWQARADALAARLGLKRSIRLLASVRIAAPALVGWVRPAIVVPLAMLARMPAEQVELILAHELAHLRRLDHLANLFQIVLETLFFYHPAVHWISRDVRRERELCCDALALRASGGRRRDFLEALVGLEAFRAGHAELALAANGGVLAERAWFIAGSVQKRSRAQVRGSAILVLAVTLALGLGGLAWRNAAWQQRTASLVLASNASIRHGLQHAAVPIAALSSMDPERAQRRLQPLPYVAPASRAVGAERTLVPIRAARVDSPVRTLSAVPLRMPALASVPVTSLRVAAAVGGVRTKPEPLHTVPPVYPRVELLAGAHGQVVVEFALDAAGVPEHLQVVRSASGPFDAAAMQALARWRFTAPAVPGQRYRQVFRFRLGAEAGNDAAAGGCLVTTGTHICHRASEAAPNVRAGR